MSTINKLNEFKNDIRIVLSNQTFSDFEDLSVQLKQQNNNIPKNVEIEIWNYCMRSGRIK